MTWINRWLGIWVFFCIWLHALSINDELSSEGNSGDGVSKPSAKGWETSHGILPILKTLLQKFKYTITCMHGLLYIHPPPMDRIPFVK